MLILLKIREQTDKKKQTTKNPSVIPSAHKFNTSMQLWHYKSEDLRIIKAEKDL